MVQGPYVVNRLPTMCHDNQCPLTTKVVDQELEKGIDREGLVDISYRVEYVGGCSRDHAGPRGNGVNGDHKENADDIAL